MRCSRPSRRAARAFAPGAADPPRGCDRATVADRRDGRFHPGRGQASQLKIGTFGHAGDGNLHPTAVLDSADEGAVQRARAAFDEIFARAIELNGTITGEHGIGIAKLRYLERQLGAEHMALLRRIKAAFDPNGILNPGKLGS